MSQSGPVARSTFRIFTGGPGPDHPMIVPQFSVPFTLLANAKGGYEMTFVNPFSTAVRVYAKGFSNSSPELCWDSISVGPSLHTPNALRFTPEKLSGSTQLWIGSWWDDGSYPGTAQGVAAYFADHPAGSEHHTVPILVG